MSRVALGASLSTCRQCQSPAFASLAFSTVIGRDELFNEDNSCLLSVLA
jgi:hypothetical protein